MSKGFRSAQELVASRQHHRLLRLSFPDQDAPAAALFVNAIEARESLSRPFEFIVELLSDEPNLALKDMQGKMMCVQLVRRNGSLRYFTGRVFSFRLKTVDGGVSYYEARLGPWYQYLSMRKDNYLFHYTSLYDQTASIFGDYSGLASWDWRVRGATEVMTDACQFDETDSNYLERRWAKAGIFYWFEHSESGHTLVLSDDSTATAAIDDGPDLPFQRHGGSTEEDGLSEWSPVRHVIEGTVSLSSYDFKVARPLHASLPTLMRQGAVPNIERYEYAGAYGFKDGADGRVQAELGMEALEADGKQFEGKGNNRQLMPGRWFRLSGHFDSDARGGDEQAREFLITELVHIASNNYHTKDSLPSVYDNRLSALRRIIPWRVPRNLNSTETKIHGIQTATVVGPAGEEIHTDQYGRVRVQFHWDRVGHKDEKSSAWIRVATPWTGPNFGMTHIPRIGTEVLVQFLDGNPDRPIITGMVPNSDTMPPWTLPQNKTQSGILTRSSPGGQYHNANALRFEDKKGQEQLWLHAEKDQLTEVEHDEDKWVGHDRRKKVDRDETSRIGRDRTERVDHNERISIGDNRTEEVGKNETLTVHQNRSRTVHMNETVAVRQSRTKTIRKNEIDKIGRNWSIKVDKVKTETIGVGHLENIGLARATNIGVAYSLVVGTVRNATVGMMDRLWVGRSRNVWIGKTYDFYVGQTEKREVGQTQITTVGEHLELSCGAAKLVLHKDGGIFLQGKRIEMIGSEAVNIDGALIQIDRGAAKPPPLPPGSKKDEEQEKKKGPRADQDDKSPGSSGKTGKSWPGAPRAGASGAAPRSSIVAPRSGEPHPNTRFVPRPTPRVFGGMDTAEILAVTVERLLNEGGKALASIEKMKALAATIKAIDAGDNAAAATAIATLTDIILPEKTPAPTDLSIEGGCIMY
ncbi:type VI secretion system tip protein VgrG [Massilia sp. CCM 8695]|uniref:Type VI secretion system tip protein VgrG n=1 Tax=Massilia frigida TaxID=2609281 RepID=A0ABX0NHR4_9BURK|nr:type VI secretion system tip protein TssI/VgrG [Massilia frigida]NHZ82747.1 type VI secretion system tip protein VgrG [Massilia frigida]